MTRSIGGDVSNVDKGLVAETNIFHHFVDHGFYKVTGVRLENNLVVI